MERLYGEASQAAGRDFLSWTIHLIAVPVWLLFWFQITADLERGESWPRLHWRGLQFCRIVLLVQPCDR